MKGHKSGMVLGFVEYPMFRDPSVVNFVGQDLPGKLRIAGRSIASQCEEQDCLHLRTMDVGHCILTPLPALMRVTSVNHCLHHPQLHLPVV